MGKAARRRRQDMGKQRTPGAGNRGADGTGQKDDPRGSAEAAITRLVRGNPPGKVSLAGAYALGYAALGMAQMEGEHPQWYPKLDPLDTLFLGAVWPGEFRDGYEFANALTAWLRLMRGTVHWKAIERFVREVLAASADHDLPVDEGELMLLLAGRLEAAGLDQRKIPRSLLPGTALASARLACGPAYDATLPDPPPRRRRPRRPPVGGHRDRVAGRRYGGGRASGGHAPAGPARAWGGASLASRLEAAARTQAGDSVADDVLFATAVAVIQSPGA